MAKHKKKIQRALDARIAEYSKINSPEIKAGMTKPGSQNRTKTGYYDPFSHKKH